MINHIWSVLCQKSVIDQQTNNLSLFDVFESLEVNINPVPNVERPENLEFNLPVQYEIVTLLSKEDADTEDTTFKIKITYINPDQKEKELVSQDLTFPANKKRMRSISQIQGLPVSKSGDYHFMVELGEDENFKKIADLPIEVKLNITSTPQKG